MNVDFLCRFLKPVDKEKLEEFEEYAKAQKLILGEDFNFDAERNEYLGDDLYEYSPISFDLKDVKLFNGADDIHTSIRFYGNDAFIIKCDYEKFREIYQSLSGKVIHDFTKTENISFSGEQSTLNQDGEKG